MHFVTCVLRISWKGLNLYCVWNHIGRINILVVQCIVIFLLEHLGLPFPYACWRQQTQVSVLFMLFVTMQLNIKLFFIEHFDPLNSLNHSKFRAAVWKKMHSNVTCWTTLKVPVVLKVTDSQWSLTIITVFVMYWKSAVQWSKWPPKPRSSNNF